MNQTGPEFGKRYSNASETDEGHRRSSGSLQLPPLDSPNRYRSHSKVSFTIGDSSDCDSGTTESGSVTLSEGTSIRRDIFKFALREYDDVDQVDLNSGQSGNDDLGNGLDNPWRKFHFRSEKETGYANGSLKRTKLQNSDREVSASGGGSENGVGRFDNSNRNNNTGQRSSIEEEEELDLLSPTTSTTGLMIPNFPNQSLARLDDVNSEGEEGEDGVNRNGKEETCRGVWGKWRILVACAMVQLFSALMVSLQAPFYPAEAEKKGSTATEYAFVFGVFELTVFIVAPFYGSRIHRWDPRLVFHIGIFTAAISSIVFGLLDQIPSGKYFIAASALVRALEALGESAVITSSFVIVATAFPDSVASTFAIVETFYSLGLVSGPIVGSVLYQIGGYPVPFLVVGGLLLAAAILSFVILPSSQQISEYQQEKDEPVVISSYRSFRLLGIGGVAIAALCIVLGALSIAHLQATLEPHLRQFGISQLTTGAILVINGGVYTVTAPFWGLLCDKVVQLKLVCFCGIAVLMSGFSLIGPVPLFDIEQKLWILAVGLTLQGIGLGAVLVSSFVSILKQAIRKGLPDSPSTYGLVSSLWTSMFSLGSFIGASLSGVLFDSIGFSNGTLTVIGFACLMMILLLIFMFTSDAEFESFTQDPGEDSPLLNNSTGISGSFYSNPFSPSPRHHHHPTSSTSYSRRGSRKSPQTSHRNSYGSTYA